MAYEEYRSAKSEAVELAAQRLTFGLESQLTIESVRGAGIDAEMRLAQELQQARVGMQTFKERSSSRLESVAILQDLLKQSQKFWRAADTEL